MLSCANSQFRRPSGWRHFVCLAAGFFGVLAVAHRMAADETTAAAKDKGREQGKPAVKKLVKPKDWPAGSSAARGRLELRGLPSDGRPRVDRRGRQFRPQRSRPERNDLLRLPRRQHVATTSRRTRGSSASSAPRKAPISRAAANATPKRPRCWPRARTTGISARRSTPNTRCASTATATTTSAIRRPISSWRPCAAIATTSPDKDVSEPGGGGRRERSACGACCGRCIRKNLAPAENPVPEAFRKDVDALRDDTMQAIHTAKEIPAERGRRAQPPGRNASHRAGEVVTIEAMMFAMHRLGSRDAFIRSPNLARSTMFDRPLCPPPPAVSCVQAGSCSRWPRV